MFSFSSNVKNFIKKLTYKVVAAVVTTLVCFIGMPFLAINADAARIKTVVVGYYEGNDLFQNGFSDDVRKTGYAYDYYQELLKYTNWNYKYYYGTSAEIEQAILNGDVDIIAGIPKTEALEKAFLFPNTPMGAEGLYIYCRADRQGLYGKKYSMLGQEIGYVKSAITEEILNDYLSTLEFNAQTIAFDTVQERDEAFARGDIRLVVASDNIRPANTKPVVKIGSVDFYFAVNKDRNDILGELNVAQTKLLDANPFFIANLQQKYFVRNNTSGGLSAEDLQYINGNDIIIGAVKNYMPYCDYDAKNDKALGLVSTLADELSSLYGKEVKVKFYDDFTELLDGVYNGEVSVAFPVLNDTWSAEMRKLLLTSKVATDRTALIFNGVYNYAPNSVVAVTRQVSVPEEYIRQLYGEKISIKVFDTINEAVKAVEKGEVDLAISGSNHVNRYLSEYSLSPTIQVVYNSDELEYCVGVPEGETKLYSTINKAIMLVDAGVFEESVVANSYVKADFGLRDFLKHYSWVVLLVLLLITVVLAGTAIAHNTSVRNHNIELSHMNAQLLDKLDVIKRQKSDMRLDSLTQVNNRFRMEEYLTELMNEYNPYGRSSLYLAVMDLDRFKHINDTFGHATGDDALVTMASVLKKACNGTSVFLARFGGDEFIMAGEADDESEFTRVLDKIQPMLDRESLGKQYKLQVSIGVAAHKFENESLEDWFKRADAAQYEVKQEHHRLMDAN